MTRILSEHIQDMDIVLEEYDLHPEVSDDITQTLARLLGWHEGQQRFKKIIVDTDGRILVSTSPTQASSAVQSVATANTTGVVLFNSNPSRKQYIIQNNGSGTIFISFGSPFNLATALPLASGGIFADDVYTGAVYVGTSTGTNEVRGVEM